MVRIFLIGCAFLLLVVGCSGTRSETSNKKEQGHTKATNTEQTRSPEATASEEEARCGGTRTIKQKYREDVVTNDVSGCPKGGLLRGTDGRDTLDGKSGDDEVRGLGGSDDISGRSGSDVLYGGPGNDFMEASDYQARDRFMSKASKDVLYGGPGRDHLLDFDAADDVLYGGSGDDNFSAGKGEDVYYGGGGNDLVGDGNDGQRDKLYCGEGRDQYVAEKLDYVDSSCEKKMGPGGRVD